MDLFFGTFSSAQFVQEQFWQRKMLKFHRETSQCLSFYSDTTILRKRINIYSRHVSFRVHNTSPKRKGNQIHYWSDEWKAQHDVWNQKKSTSTRIILAHRKCYWTVVYDTQRIQSRKCTEANSRRKLCLNLLLVVFITPRLVHTGVS